MCRREQPGTYRYAIGTVIPEMTQLAWEDKEDEIRARTPGIGRDTFVFTLTREQYETQYGTDYRKPGFFTRVLFFAMKIIPKVGPFRPLTFEPLTPEAAALFDKASRPRASASADGCWRCARVPSRSRTATSTRASPRTAARTRWPLRRMPIWRSCWRNERKEASLNL